MLAENRQPKLALQVEACQESSMRGSGSVCLAHCSDPRGWRRVSRGWFEATIAHEASGEQSATEGGLVSFSEAGALATLGALPSPLPAGWAGFFEQPASPPAAAIHPIISIDVNGL